MIHALAQLPPSVALERTQTPDEPLLRLITDAYGLTDRVRLREMSDPEELGFITSGDFVSASELFPATFAEIVERLGHGAASPVDERLDVGLSGQRVVVITNYPAHYRLPLFEGIARRLAAVQADFCVLFLAAGEQSRPWLTGPAPQFEHQFLSSVRLPIRQRSALVPNGLRSRLRAQRPTIILLGGFSPLVARSASHVARELGATLGVWSGETPSTRTARSPIRRIIRPGFVAQTGFGIAYGSRAASYLRSLRPDLPLVIGRNTAPILAVPSKGSAAPGDTLNLVFIGDLGSSRKGADIAIEAMQSVPNRGVRLNIIGGGRLLGELEKSAARDERISFLGPLGPEEVKRQLFAADAFLFPTRSDVFGLALVEAMGASLASIVSTAAGAVDDLAVDQLNSIVVCGHDPADWAAAINGLALPTRAGDLGARARRTIEARWTIDHAVEGMLAGLRLGAAVRSTTT